MTNQRDCFSPKISVLLTTLAAALLGSCSSGVPTAQVINVSPEAQTSLVSNILRVEPQTTSVGSTITVIANGLEGGETVTFGVGTATPVTVPAATVEGRRLTVIVPPGAVTGPITVTSPDGSSVTTPFSIIIGGAPGPSPSPSPSVSPSPVPMDPVITEVEDPVFYGDELTITGMGLGKVNAVVFQTGGRRDPGTITVEPESASSTQVVVVVPFGAVDGSVSVTTSDSKQATSPETEPFVLATPQIEDFENVSNPALSLANEAIPGQTIAIVGENFYCLGETGINCSNIAVRFRGSFRRATVIEPITSTELQVVVPAGIRPGPVEVSIDRFDDDTDTVESAQTLELLPIIENISGEDDTRRTPGGPVGTLATITGRGFASFLGETPTVTFSGNRRETVPSPTVTVVSDTEITAEIPVGAETGPVTVGLGLAEVETDSFAITQLLSVENIVGQGTSTRSGKKGTNAVITGRGFAQGAVVTFSGDGQEVVGTVVSVNAEGTEIVVTIPDDAETGPVTVELNGESDRSPRFTVENLLSITSINPTSGPVGTSITITGTGFDQDSNPIVTFPGRLDPITISDGLFTDTTITTAVPDGARSGNITVQVEEESAQTDRFRVTR